MVAGASCAVLCGPCRIASLTDATVSCLLTLQNRLDHIDPALRRPGRFDREFLFQLPSLVRTYPGYPQVPTGRNRQNARRDILGIHTAAWKPPLRPDFLLMLAER